MCCCDCILFSFNHNLDRPLANNYTDCRNKQGVEGRGKRWTTGERDSGCGGARESSRGEGKTDLPQLSTNRDAECGCGTSRMRNYVPHPHTSGAHARQSCLASSFSTHLQYGPRSHPQLRAACKSVIGRNHQHDTSAAAHYPNRDGVLCLR